MYLMACILLPMSGGWGDLVQPQRREDKEELDEHGAERQDAADQHRHRRLHVPGRLVVHDQ